MSEAMHPLVLATLNNLCTGAALKSAALLHRLNATTDGVPAESALSRESLTAQLREANAVAASWRTALAAVVAAATREDAALRDRA
jgi:hypothetical protein